MRAVVPGWTAFLGAVMFLLPPRWLVVRAFVWHHPQHNPHHQAASLSRTRKILERRRSGLYIHSSSSSSSSSATARQPPRSCCSVDGAGPRRSSWTNRGLPGLPPPPVPSLVVLRRSSFRRQPLGRLFGTVTAEDMASPSSSSTSTASLDKPTNATVATTTAADPPLDWETFEFGLRPKRDPRFGSDDIELRNATDVQLLQLRTVETERDTRLAIDLQRQTDAWETLDLNLVHRATEVLRPYIQDKRLNKMQTVLARRTGHTRFLYENPSNPSNVWACLRTLDAFGIQHVNVVLASQLYRGKDALSMKRGIRTAMGSAHWLTVKHHQTSVEAVTHLKSQGFKLFAADVNPKARDIRTIDWVSESNHSPLCLVMGNEEAGISDEMRFLADETFYLPMDGFAESYNLSVATAIACAHLSAASSSSDSSSMQGPLRPGDLSLHERDCLLLKGMLKSIANKKIVPALLKQHNLVLPKEIFLL